MQPLASAAPRPYANRMASAEILNRRVISLEGAEARTFLQGLITNDISQCQNGQAIYAALLTPQGKILFDFFLIAGATGDALYLDCDSERAGDVVKRLGFYRLRAKVDIALQPDLAVAAVWNGSSSVPAASLLAYPDPRLTALGRRAIGPRAGIEAVLGQSSGDYSRHRVSLGVPDSEDLPPDQVFALDAGLEELHGVSFSKGCYIGQEVTARMKHRATARRRFFIAEAASLPPAGTAIEADGRELGRITSSIGDLGLAHIRLDRLAEARQQNLPLLAGATPVILRKPDWLSV